MKLSVILDWITWDWDWGLGSDECGQKEARKRRNRRNRRKRRKRKKEEEMKVVRSRVI